MIKVTYYIGTCDKDTCKKELLDREFYRVFDELFINYTLQRAQGVYTMQEINTVVKENTFIVTTFLDGLLTSQQQLIMNNVNKLKDVLNQESILVETQEVTACIK